MNRYEQLKDLFFKEIEKNCFGIYKQKAYFHTIQVCTLCQIGRASCRERVCHYV